MMLAFFLLSAPVTPPACQPDSLMAIAAFEATATLRQRTDSEDAVERVEWVGAVDAGKTAYLAIIDRDWFQEVFALVSCDHRVLGVQGTGQVDTVRLVHLTDSPSADAVVEYLSGHGTGWVQHSFAILGLGADSIRVLLDLVTTEISDDPAANGAYDDSATVRLAPDGMVVRKGKRFKLHCPMTGHCRNTTWTPILERYRWDPAEHRFERLGGAARSPRGHR